MLKVVEVTKDDYFEIVVMWKNSQSKLYDTINPDRNLWKMYWLNLIESLVKDYSWLNEVWYSDTKIDFIISEINLSSKKAFSDHIEVLCKLFDIQKSVVEIIESHILALKKAFQEKWKVIFSK